MALGRRVAGPCGGQRGGGGRRRLDAGSAVGLMRARALFVAVREHLGVRGITRNGQ